MMDEGQAVAAFAARGQPVRPGGDEAAHDAQAMRLAEGLLAEAVGVSTTNLSFHLKELSRAGLVTAQREGRSIRYRAAYPDLSALIQFLMRDCCQGRPEVCAPAVAALATCCPETA